MTIKEAKQNGRNISIKYDNTTKQTQGELIGFTTNAVFVKSNRNLVIYVYKNGSGVVPCGHNISLLGNEDIKMYGNKVGVKKPSNPTVQLYDETGRSAGRTSAR